MKDLEYSVDDNVMVIFDQTGRIIRGVYRGEDHGKAKIEIELTNAYGDKIGTGKCNLFVEHNYVKPALKT